MKKKKKNNFLKYNYSKCFEFFKTSKPYILFATILFFIIAILGFIFPVFFREEIFSIMKEMTGLLAGKNTMELIFAIFLNNLKASFMSMILGIGVAVFPVATAVVNGYILGFVAREVVNTEGLFVLWQLLPHGVFEIPAILLSIGIGIRIGTDLFKKNAKRETKNNIIEGLRFFAFVVFPLLLIAGIIEGILITLLA